MFPAAPIQRVTDQELQQGKLNLRKAGRDIGNDTSDRFRLGPVDKGQTDVKRLDGMEGHEYADLVGKHIAAHGYDPEQPSRIDRKRNFERKARRMRQGTGYGNLLAGKMNQMRRAMGYEDDE